LLINKALCWFANHHGLQLFGSSKSMEYFHFMRLAFFLTCYFVLVVYGLTSQPVVVLFGPLIEPTWIQRIFQRQDSQSSPKEVGWMQWDLVPLEFGYYVLVSGARTKNECFCCQVGFEATRVSLFIHSWENLLGEGIPCMLSWNVGSPVWYLADRLFQTYFILLLYLHVASATATNFFAPSSRQVSVNGGAVPCSDVGSCARKQESSPDGKVTPRMKGEDLLLAVQLIQSVYVYIYNI
jgi:hypothetical protein